MKVKKLNKPKLQTKHFYDYIECREYIKAKLGLEERPFWTYMCDSQMISNGAMFSLFRETFMEEYNSETEIDDYEKVKAFHDAVFEEFGKDLDSIDFEVWW